MIVDSSDGITFEPLLESLAAKLVSRDEMLATAESCTGGWVAKICTDLAGSSAWFERGFVTYSNQAKQDMLGVSADTLADHGAVSEQTVREMVDGALSRSQARWALAISGIAGPGGGSAGKPVGSVWFGWGGPSGWRRSQLHCFAGDRDAVRRQAVWQALDGLAARCLE
ncbi:Nicotinamide-nucleotide amidase [hydrothermal vent metagenome]|uniref:Nicotinamide-nucleotide amidase n=1 Tax=hydrothermal vent metagenome TaxID=652676 RepID=A0A3B0YTL8_9ZZZZ